jgi:uncharacterized protein YwqG
MKKAKNNVQEKDDKKHIHSSRIGGRPNLPENMAWPTFHIKDLAYSMRTNVLKEVELNVPYDFLAQINCKELSKELHDIGFPTDGMIFFFIKNDLDDYGLNDKDDYRVLYAPSKAISSETSEKPKKPSAYDHEKRWRIYQRNFDFRNDGDNHGLIDVPDQVGGKPKWIQSDMKEIAQKDTYGKGAKLPEEVLDKKWVLLLQTRIDEDGIYFLVPITDLQKKDFGRVWCTDQNT